MCGVGLRRWGDRWVGLDVCSEVMEEEGGWYDEINFLSENREIEERMQQRPSPISLPKMGHASLFEESSFQHIR